ncbi:MAG: PH domain-containing protein [Chloroflexi bacterium]|nr:MAG: PH domain-containing protein [Chloroflexota bacterium]
MAGDLLPGENLILKLHQHWIFVAKSLLIPIALLLLVVVADIVLGSTNANNIRLPLTLAIVAIALLWLIVVWIRWRSIVYTLTDQRIKLESGVFSRSEKIIPIDRIQDCTTRQSLIGRILGYGRVEVDAAGAQGAEVLVHLPKPGVFRDHVFVQSERRRGVVRPRFHDRERGRHENPRNLRQAWRGCVSQPGVAAPT